MRADPLAFVGLHSSVEARSHFPRQAWALAFHRGTMKQALEVGGVDTVRFAGWFYRKIARVPGLEDKVLSALNSGGFATLVELLTVYRMDEQVAEQPEPFVYEQMYQYLYDYHFGRITFLELLEKWKAVLDLPTDNPAAYSSAA